MRRILSLGVLAAALALTGCPEQTAVWIEDGSTAEQLSFGVGKTEGGAALGNLAGLTVFPCQADGTPQNAVWVIARSGEGAVPSRVVYGQAPTGYRTVKGPEPLPPGCYMAGISGSGRVRFHVTQEGAIRRDGE
jgi:hypothetical protein